MKVVLAEKPSVAREIAAVLGAKARRDGYFEGRGYQITWALGHLATLKEPEDYDPALKPWSLATLPIVPERFGLKRIEDAGARKQFAVVQRLFRAADELIAATDAGREGELIFRYILELTGCLGKPARRLWLGSLTEEAIRDAFRRLRPLADYDALYAAARCRSEADWIVGLNATRYYTVRHGARGLLWSAGRVQTPVLALIVRRDDAIRTFRPEPFWELVTRYRESTFKFTGDRFWKEEEGQELLRQVQGHEFVIQNLTCQQERVPPPLLYDLTELQRDMNRRFGLSAEATLKAAQALYEGKLISYPRTDSRHLGSDLKPQIPGILRTLQRLRPDEIGQLDLDALAFTGQIINDRKVTDHHAIIPTGKLPGSLSPAGQKVYGAVVTRLIAVFYPVCLKDVTTVDGTSNEVPFRARGVRVLDPGWTVLYPRRSDEKNEDDQELPAFRPGEHGPHVPFLRAGATTPPKHYTESTLLGAMETAGKLVDDEQLKEALKERGLGTPATRAAIIEMLLARGYIAREKKTLTATDLGRYLIALIQDRQLKSAELTGEWEAKLRAIERGQLDPRQFMKEIVRYTGDLVRSGESAAIDESKLGDCPRCGRPVIAGKRGFGCSGWREGCPFVLWRVYNDQPLEVGQIRELLQRRVLLPPRSIVGADTALVSLTDSGALVEIPVPSARSSRVAGQAEVRSKSHRPESSNRPPARKPVGALVSLGACPRCGSEVVDRPRFYGCSGWTKGCKFAIGKTIAGKRIGVRTAQALLREGRTDLLKGFKSKAGTPFEALLKVDEGEVRFEFASPRRDGSGARPGA
jgi:DNA topoisomerase-3